MITQKALDVAKSVSGVLISGKADGKLTSLSTDSRCVNLGDLFVPIKGERFNGHDFIDDAMSGGAIGFFTENWDDKVKRIAGRYSDSMVIKVGDTLHALHRLAAKNRELSGARTIGITGSTGKTSTKSLIDGIMSLKYRVVTSRKNFNNEIGLPLTLLRGDAATEVFVLEMGMRGIGQIGKLVGLSKPEVGVITNIGESHHGLLGSREAIANAKAELTRSLPFEGFAVLNADDPWTPILIDMTDAKIVTFGLSPVAQYCATNICMDSEARASFVAHTPIGNFTATLSVPGRHMVYNALAAIATACCFGIDFETIAEGLRSAYIDEMRMSIISGSLGVTIINDTYNASPSSMRAALETTVAINSNGKRIAVLGDMAELGEISSEAHYEVGKAAAALGIDLLIAVGEEARNMLEGAIAGGLSASRVLFYADRTGAIEFLKNNLTADDVVLIKASRCMEFEKIVQSL